MAKQAKKKKAVKRVPTSRALAIRTLLSMVGIGIVFVAAMPTAIVFIVGMVPTLVSHIVDMTPGRWACRCVAGLNIAGVTPFINKLWSGAKDLEAALRIITDSLAWLSFYATAGFGWMLFMSLPGVVAAWQIMNARRRVHVLRETQKELAREWGFSETSDDSNPAAEDDEKAEAKPAPAG